LSKARMRAKRKKIFHLILSLGQDDGKAKLVF